MATTVADVIRDALERLGVVPIGEAVPTAFSTLGLTRLNSLIQDWGVEGLLLPYLTEVTHNTSNGTASYTIGAGGVINVRRPVEIVDAVLSLNSNFYRLKTYNASFRYRDYESKPKSQPNEVFYEPSYPLGKVVYYPTPDAAYAMTLYFLTTPAPYALATDDIALPPEYDHALGLALAVQLMPVFGKTDQTIIGLSEESKAALRRNNSKRLTQISKVDNALTLRGGRGNIMTGWV